MRLRPETRVLCAYLACTVSNRSHFLTKFLFGEHFFDVSQTVGARLDSGADGVVYGLSRRGGWLQMRHLDRAAEVRPGELVLTNDNADLRTARVPGGLIIGKVDDAKTVRDPQSDTLSVEVIPLVNYEKLQVVTVVLTDGS